MIFKSLFEPEFNSNSNSKFRSRIFFYFLFFLILFFLTSSCATVNFGPLSRGQPHSQAQSRYVDHCVSTILPEPFDSNYNTLTHEAFSNKNSYSPWVNTFFWFPSGDKTSYEFFLTYFLEKYDGLSESVAFGRNWGYFTDENGPKWGTTSKWILTIFKHKNEKSGKSRWKKWFISLVSMFPSWVMVLKLSKKSAFFAILCWPQQEI